MRRHLVEQLIKQDTKDTYFLTAGVGFGVLEPLQEKMGERFINVGIAEQSMIGIASGLALSGKIVYTYTMCCFYLKCIENIKLDLCYQNAPVTMIGVGTQFDYEQHGSSHFALEDEDIINCLYNIEVHTPYDIEYMSELISAKAKWPRYIRISRFDENKDCELMLEKYPKCGGSLSYLQKRYGTKRP